MSGLWPLTNDGTITPYVGGVRVKPTAVLELLGGPKSFPRLYAGPTHRSLLLAKPTRQTPVSVLGVPPLTLIKGRTKIGDRDVFAISPEGQVRVRSGQICD